MMFLEAEERDLVRWMLDIFGGLIDTFLVEETIAAFAIVAISDSFKASTAITSPQIIPSHHKMLVDQRH